MTIKQFAEEIIHITERNRGSNTSRRRWTTRRSASPTSGARTKFLGWEPKVEFEEDITRTNDYFRQWLERANQR